MPDGSKNLGRLVAVHAIAPAYMQRAVFIAVLSFVFFLVTMVIYYLRANLLYFLLATAFLLIYLAMMVSIVFQRKSVAEVFENGLRFRSREIDWDQIDAISDDGVIQVSNGKPIRLPSSLNDLPRLIQNVRSRIRFGLEGGNKLC